MELAKYREDSGTWVLYDYDQGPYAITHETDPVKIIEDLRNQGHGKIMFHPIGVPFTEAVEKWINDRSTIKENPENQDDESKLQTYIIENGPVFTCPDCAHGRHHQHSPRWRAYSDGVRKTVELICACLICNKGLAVKMQELSKE